MKRNILLIGFVLLYITTYAGEPAKYYKGYGAIYETMESTEPLLVNPPIIIMKFIENDDNTYTIQFGDGSGTFNTVDEIKMITTDEKQILSRNGHLVNIVGSTELHGFLLADESYITEDSLCYSLHTFNVPLNMTQMVYRYKGRLIQEDFTSTMTWMQEETATGYLIDVYNQSARLVITLEFDANGTYIGIVRRMSTLKTTEEFSFDASTLDLEKNATYYYTISALNGEEKVQIKEGVFTLSDDTPTAVQTLPGTTPTVVGYYNIIGQRLVGEPHKGLYIIRYNDGTSTKVVR
jgi:hypothetical protein